MQLFPFFLTASLREGKILVALFLFVCFFSLVCYNRKLIGAKQKRENNKNMKLHVEQLRKLWSVDRI